jgi:NADH:ubiquinone oxidoreductase subunit 2 (subunit N)
MQTFNTILNHSHSGLRWLVLVFLILAVANAFTAKTFEKKHKMINLFALITVHLQLAIGLVQYFLSDKVQFIDGWMKNPLLRFYGMEHLVGMLLAIILITIGYSKAKRKENPADKFKAIRIFYTLGLIIILLFIPWPFRTILGGGWF